MGFLQKLLKYKKVCIQCHNNPDPDTVASAFGVQRFLNQNGIESRIVYGGPQGIIKANLKILIKECGIKIEKVDKIEENVVNYLIKNNYIELCKKSKSEFSVQAEAQTLQKIL